MSSSQPSPVPRTAKALRKCKACQPCRERKIKCDGQQPSCTACAQQDYSCRYNQDKRQTSRVSKEAVNSINFKVASLEQLVRRLENTNQARLPSTAGSGSGRPIPAPPYIPVDGSVDGDGNTFQGVQPAYVPAPLATPRTFASFDAIENVDNENIPQQDVPVPHGKDHGRETIVPRIHMMVSNSNTVHGPTSTFHPQSFSPASSKESSVSIVQPLGTDLGQPSKPSFQNDIDEQGTRAQLFMYAALEKQKEFSYMVEQRFDFDSLDYDTAMHLLDLHWNHQHCAFLWSYRPAIMNSLATGGSHVSKLLLNAIFYSAALNSDRETCGRDANNRQSAGERFLLRFQSLLLDELEKSSIPNVIALLQVGSSLVSNGRQTAGWLYSGLGYRMIIDLGLHLDPGAIQTCGAASHEESNLSSVDIEVQRRVFWGAYVNDKFQSLYFGRPPALTATGVEPPLQYLDTYEELELWSPYIDPQNPNPVTSSFIPKPAYAISTFTWLVTLANITAEITEKLYMPCISGMSSPMALDHLTRLQGKLDEWQEKLPQHLRFDPEKDPAPPMHQFNIHTTYHTLVILLHRPFLPEGHLKHIGLEEQLTRGRCVSAALKIYHFAKAYRNSFTLRRAPYLFSYALFSAMTVIPHHNTLGWSSLADKEMMAFFWNALKELQQGSNFGLRKPIKIIRDFLDRAGVNTNTLAAARTNTATRPSPGPDSNLGADAYGGEFPSAMDIGVETYADMFPGLYTDNSDWLEWPNNESEMRDNDHTLYGLFRSS